LAVFLEKTERFLRFSSKKQGSPDCRGKYDLIYASFIVVLLQF